MDNFLENGAVLPSGLLSDNDSATMAGFNKSYRNFPLRIGVVTASYPVSNDKNRSKLTTEYDVLVIEQNEDRGATTIQYRNCMSSEGLGSIADFFEKALRPKKKKTTKGNSVNLKGQDGAIVLLLCLDGMSDKGIIISALTHPDRKTKLIDEGPYLEGEYNGVNVKVNKDGSTSLSFRGATDSQGNPVSPTQGVTQLQIDSDGSFQVEHDKIKFRLDRNGDATLNTKKDVNLNVDGKVNIIVKGDANVQCDNLSVKASGDADVNVDGNAKIKAAEITLNGSAGKILTTTTDPVVDTIFGIPTQGVPTVKSG